MADNIVCSKCSKDLTFAFHILGEDAIRMHEDLHRRRSLVDELRKIWKGLNNPETREDTMKDLDNLIKGLDW